MDSNSGKTILLVEDSPTQQTHIKHVLEVNQYSVVVGNNGKEALQKLKQYKIDLIISDVMMPEMDGLELCRELKKDLKLNKIPIILLTSLAKVNHLIDGLEAGADNYMPKPINEKFLIDKVENIICREGLDLSNSESTHVISIPLPSERRFIQTSPKILMDYLLSTYEAILIKNQELEKTMDDLEDFNDHLEEMVEERTRQLLLETVEKKQFQTSFEESEHKYKQLVDNAQIGVCIVNTEGELIFVNSGFCEMLRYENPDLLKQVNIDRLYADREESKKFIDRIQKLKRVEGYESKLITQSGTVIHVLINAVFEKENISSFIMDISEKIFADQQLKESEELLNKITNAVHDVIIVLNPANRITFWNPAARETFGYHEMEAIGMDFFDIAISDSYVNPIRKRIEADDIFSKNNGNKYRTAYGIRKDHSKFPFEYSLSRITMRDEVFTVMSLRDISERVENERKLKEARARAEESDKLKSAFLSNLSHEIRTPMNAIMGFSYLLSDSKSEIPDVMEYLGLISNSCSNLLEIIEDIVDISKIETQQQELQAMNFDLNALIKETFLIIQNSEKYSNTKIDLRFTPHIDKPEVNIMADRTNLGKILTNLIKNGIKFTKSGFVEVGYKLTNDYMIEFFVKDTGIGIPSQKLSLIFEKFRQLEDVNTKQYGGTGIGLTITKKLVELFGGQIWVESKKDVGSTFYFTIPYKESEQSRKGIQTGGKSKVNQFNFHDKRILIAEDIESNYILLKTLLRKTEAELIWVQNGRKAVEYIQDHEDVDLILMDIQMPEMDGYEAMSRIKKINPTIPVIAQSAYALEQEKDKIVKSGFKAHFVKPLPTDQFLNTIQKFFLE